MQAARGQLQDSVGEDFDGLRDLDLRRYRPRTFLREQLFGEPDAPQGDDPSAPPVATGGRAGDATRLPPAIDWDAT